MEWLIKFPSLIIIDEQGGNYYLLLFKKRVDDLCNKLWLDAYCSLKHPFKTKLLRLYLP
jgi:hypothetical protein